ncbi:MAG: hypothetical protein ACKOFF_04575 [Acidimicrobiales bacterium]
MKTRVSRVLAAVLFLCGSLVAAAPQVSAEAGGGATAPMSTSMGRIAAGDRTNCVVVEGRLACWGSNLQGQIGDGTSSDRSMATYVPGLTGVQSVAVSERNTCVIVSGGGVKCWGDNTYGQLGNGAFSSGNTTSPVDVCAVGGCGSGNLTGATQLSMGFGFACAVLSSSGVACWGYNNVYQLGATSPATSSSPLEISGLTGVTAVTSGRSHTCVIVTGGAMKCWGEGNRGQLGDGTTTKNTPVSVDRVGVSGVTAIAATREATCAIVTGSKVKCWGGDAANELGYDSGNPSPNIYDMNLATTFTTQVPVTPQLGGVELTAKAIDGGPRAVCIISLTDSLACWGSIAGLGIATGGTNFGAAFSSNWVSGMTSTTNVAVSTSTVCATNAGTVQCWGAGPFGELGNNTTGTSPSSAATVLGLVTQTVTFESLPARTTADSPFVLTGTSSSGQALTYASLTPAVCDESLAGSTWTLSIIGPGTCTVEASATGGMVSGTYYAPATVSRSFTVTAVAPVVTLSAASAVSTTAATLTATVNPALRSTTSVFKYSIRQDLSNATSVGSATTAAGAGVVTLTADLTGLSPGVTYYFGFEATNSVGTTSATARSFTTVGFAPKATTGSPTSVSASRGTLNASVTPGGLLTEVWFTWGEKQDLSDGKKLEYRSVSDLSAIDVSVTLTGLVESTRYYYRVEASNGLGSVKGDILSFVSARPVGVSVNDAAEFTNSRNVTVYVTGTTGSVEAILSNDGGFSNSKTFTLTDSSAEIPWTLVASKDERLPKVVYVKFVSRLGTASTPYQDDIILDTTAPTMSGASASTTASSPSNVTAAAAKGGVRMTVRASDRNSGIGKVQVKTSSRGSITDVPTSSPKATSRTVRINTAKKR